MPQISLISLEEVQDALERYTAVVDSSELTIQSKATYLLHANQFVRWLADDFEPGSTLRGRPNRRR